MKDSEGYTIVEPGRPEEIVQLDYTRDEYIEHFSDLVELEREEEMKRHEREMKGLEGWEREKRGRAILDARARDEGMALGGKSLVKFVRRDGLPETEISVGDLIRVSKRKPLDDNNPSGTVTEKTGYSLTAAFDDRPPGWIYDKVRVDLYVNDITYQRMLDSLDKLCSLEGKKKKLLDKILSEGKLEYDDTDEVSYINRELNNSQKEAVINALRSEDIYLIHGPPGTGKTVTCVEIIEQFIERGENVIACADSNTAVDNLVEHLTEHEKNVVRVGHPARVTPTLREHTLDYILEDNSTFVNAQELREEAYELKEEQEQFTYPSGRWRRGLSDEAIKNLAEKGKGSRGVPPDKIKEMSRSIELQEKVDELFEKVDHLEDKAVSEVLDRADVVCTTNSSSASQALEDRAFDVCVIDEATQATEPSCLIPTIKAEKLVMAGDHKQLPPTILSEKAKKEGLAETMFERLIALYGDKIKTLLEVQYRMHEKIMRFSDVHFYGGKIIADSSVRYHTLDDIMKDEPDGRYSSVIEPENPIIFIDTAGSMPERSRKDSPSKENPGEAKIAKRIVTAILDKGIEPDDIGMITPYDDQKDLLRSKVEEEDIEIDTVDGFQGREKEVIILSFTRSNRDRSIGFLNDLRRLNVSVTRAKRKLIMIGDWKTLSSNDVYRSLIKYVGEEGKILKIED